MLDPLANRAVFGQTLGELGAKEPRLVVLDADVSKGTITKYFRDAYPDRFFNFGVAEQNMMAAAAGLATTGMFPVACTFAVFASMRACDQVRTSIAYPKLNVKIVASNAGIENHGDGVTHQGIEDLSILRGMPNMVVVSPSDNVTTRLATRALLEHEGPAYMRLGRVAGETIYPEPPEFRLGKMIRIREGKDLTLIATGNQVAQALAAARALAEEGIEARVLDCHTIKPLDVEEVLRAARETRGIVTAEDHSVLGGLGSSVCEAVAGHHPVPVRRVGLRDTFACSARDPRQLLSHFHIDAAEIICQAEGMLRGMVKIGN